MAEQSVVEMGGNKCKECTFRDTCSKCEKCTFLDSCKKEKHLMFMPDKLHETIRQKMTNGHIDPSVGRPRIKN